VKQTRRRKQNCTRVKAILRLSDLEAAKSAVLNNLSCPDAQRGYRDAIDELVEWYCSEPRCRSARPWLSGTESISGRPI